MLTDGSGEPEEEKRPNRDDYNLRAVDYKILVRGNISTLGRELYKAYQRRIAFHKWEINYYETTIKFFQTKNTGRKDINEKHLKDCEVSLRLAQSFKELYEEGLQGLIQSIADTFDKSESAYCKYYLEVVLNGCGKTEAMRRCKISKELADEFHDRMKGEFYHDAEL